MGEIRSTVTLFNNMTPALQSITNALNMTISHFEQMQRTSRRSIDTSAFSAARAEIRNAEATVAEMQEALTGVARNGADVARGFDEIGIAGSQAGQAVGQAFQTVQQQQSAVIGMSSMAEQALQQITQAIQEQTNEIMIMSEAIYQFTNRTTESTERQTRQQERQSREQQRQNERVGLLQRLYQRVASTVQNVIQRNERLRAITQRVSTAVSPIASAFQRVHSIQQKVNAVLSRMTSPIRSAVRAVASLRQNLTGASNSASGLLGTLKGLAGVYLSFQGISMVGNLSDSISSVTSRLNMMNDGLRTTQGLTDVIMKSAFETGAEYIGTAEAIAKMGLNAGSAFESNSELITFMEQINKNFAIGGASAMEQSNAMVQLSQAMAAGALRGEELNSILDAAPSIARNIEKYMGYAEGSIKEYAEKGAITAQVVKNAMIAMAEETNEKFNSMPTTISRTFSQLKTLAIRSFTPVLKGISEIFNNQNAQKLSYQWGALFQYIADRATVTIEKVKNIVNSEAFMKFSQDVMTIFASVGAAITFVLDKIASSFGFVVSHWEELQPILEGAAVAIGLVTAAQWALNVAMSANPITLIIAGIVVLIAILYKVVDQINKVKNTSISVTGIIAGVFAWLYASIKNIVAVVWNTVATFINFVYNFSKDKATSIKILFLDLADNVLANIQTMVQGIRSLTDHIPHIPIVTDGIEKADEFLTKLRNNMQSTSQQLKNGMDWEEIMPTMEHTNVNEFVTEVYNKVAGFGSGFKDFMKDFDPFKGVESTNDLLADILKNTQNVTKDTGNISKELQRDKEDLEFLRTVANIKYGDKYVTPQIKIEMTNNNNIQKEMDLDGFFDRKVEEIATIVQTSAEGVHI